MHTHKNIPFNYPLIAQDCIHPSGKVFKAYRCAYSLSLARPNLVMSIAYEV